MGITTKIGQTVQLATNERHTLVVPSIRVRLADGEGKGVPNQACVLASSDGTTVKGVTDEDSSWTWTRHGRSDSPSSTRNVGLSRNPRRSK